MSDLAAPAQADTAQSSQAAPAQAAETTTQAQPQTQATQPAPVHQGLGDGPQATTNLDFIPEAYRADPSFAKYKSQDEFFKGMQNLQKLLGKREIVNIQGIELPGEKATDDDYNQFFNRIGRPESADKYVLPEDVKAPEGFDIAAERKTFQDLVHRAGLNNRQAATLFKEYMNTVTENFQKQESAVAASFDAAVKQAFPENASENLALAKKGAKALGLGNKLDQEGLSLNPTVLQIVAKIGELAGEDTFEKGGDTESNETLLDEAKRIQNSAEYKSGDKKSHARVEAIYSKVYPGKIG